MTKLIKETCFAHRCQKSFSDIYDISIYLGPRLRKPVQFENKLLIFQPK